MFSDNSEKRPLISHESGASTRSKASGGGGDEEMTHEEVLDGIGGFSWLALRATLFLIPAKVSGDLIVNIAAFYQLMPKFECQLSG